MATHHPASRQRMGKRRIIKLMNKRLFTIICLCVVGFSLQGCTAAGTIAGAAATTGVAAAQEGGLKRAWSDATIQAKINELWLREETTDIFRKLDLTVNQGRVLITGVVQDPQHRVDAVRLAWKPEGVKQVINEIRVAESKGVTGFARDTWAATRLRTAITIDRDVQSINYNIDVVQGVVYLMGVAQTRTELNRVIETARTIPDIKQVVSYVKLAGEVDQDFTPASAQEAEGTETVEFQSSNEAAAPTPLYRSDFKDIETENIE